MQMAKLLSVIIPVFNTEKFISKMVRSVISQGLNPSEYEILLMDDGSTDQSLSVCESLAEEYPDIIRVYSHKNCGVGKTRNRGTDLARGEFVCFFDSDDYLLPGRLGVLLETADMNSVDAVAFSSVTVDRYYPGDEVYLAKRPTYNVTYTGTCEDRIEKACFGSMIWNLVIRKEFIDKSGLEFADYPIGEDVVYNLELALRRPRMVIYDTDIYRYCIRRNSAVNSIDDAKVRRHIESYMSVLGHMANILHDLKDERFAKGIEELISRQYVPFFSRILRSDISKEEFEQIIADLASWGCDLNFGAPSRLKRIVSFVAVHTWTFPILRAFYRNIFFPYIHPRLRRN